MAIEVIDTDDLAAHLGIEGVATEERAEFIVGLVNGLIEEKWPSPIDPAPTSVRLMALAVAARAWRSTPGRGQLQSTTRSIDDASRTDRYVVSQAEAEGHGVFLTDADLLTLGVLPPGQFAGSWSMAQW